MLLELNDNIGRWADVDTHNNNALIACGYTSKNGSEQIVWKGPDAAIREALTEHFPETYHYE